VIVELNQACDAPTFERMALLNEVTLRFPEAISFAPGRPRESLFDVGAIVADLDTHAAHAALRLGWDKRYVLASFGQYGRTKGIVCSEVARYLATDEGIAVEDEAIVMTTGCQEALLIVLSVLCDRTTDVVLTADPTYVGIHGAAEILGVELYPVRVGEHGLDLASLRASHAEVQRRGRRARAVYTIPSFDNPGGTLMPLAARRELIAMARELDMVILEDNAYGAFCYDGDRLPTLKALAGDGSVIYLGTFSKLLIPGLRLGFVVADGFARGRSGAQRALADELAKIKSFTTVNTSPLTQAMLGGMLYRSNFSLRPHMAPIVERYRMARDAMLEALERAFPPGSAKLHGVSWNRPRGGFFITLTVPFVADAAAMTIAASRYGVIWMPMALFALAPGHEHTIRLSFSYVDQAQIEEGVRRLARFIAEQQRPWPGSEHGP